MSDALERCARVVALFSPAYFDRSRYTTEEWTAAVVHAVGMENRLVPVRVEEVPAARPDETRVSTIEGSPARRRLYRISAPLISCVPAPPFPGGAGSATSR